MRRRRREKFRTRKRRKEWRKQSGLRKQFQGVVSEEGKEEEEEELEEKVEVVTQTGCDSSLTYLVQ